MKTCTMNNNLELFIIHLCDELEQQNIRVEDLGINNVKKLLTILNSNKIVKQTQNSKPKVINLFAGPGAGKSTTAAGIFHLLKSHNIKCELVTEYAKEMSYEKRNVFDDQLYIFAKQQRKMNILRNHVEWIVTDSPLLLSVVYEPKQYYSQFRDLVLNVNNDYNNFNFFINRTKPFQQYGRNQNEEEAQKIDKQILDVLERNNIRFTTIDGDQNAPYNIISHLNNTEMLNVKLKNG